MSLNENLNFSFPIIWELTTIIKNQVKNVITSIRGLISHFVSLGLFRFGAFQQTSKLVKWIFPKSNNFSKQK